MTEKSNSADILELRRGELTAKINLLNQQLFSLERSGKEYMWGGGKPDYLKSPVEKPEAGGWQNSEILMFPVVGPCSEIMVDGQKHPMGQHGIARYLDNELVARFANTATFRQNYTANADVKTPKGTFRYPFDYSLRKSYTLDYDTLDLMLVVENKSDKPMPYAVGWHPAFKCADKNSPNSFVQASDRHIYQLKKVKELSKQSALKLEGENRVELFSGSTENAGIIVSSDLGNMMVWSPDEQPFVCIEPISALPDAGYSGELAKRPGYKMIAPNTAVMHQLSVQIRDE